MWSLNRINAIGLLAGFIFSCGSAGKKDPDKTYFKTADGYNNYINRHFEEVNRLWNAALTSMDDSALVYKQLDSLVQASDTSCKNMHKLADFKGDTLYRAAAARYFCYMNEMARNEFREAIQIGLMEDVSDSLYFRFTAIGNQIGADKDSYILQLKSAQLSFVKNNSQ